MKMSFTLFIFLLLSLTSINVFAISEKNYLQEWKEKVLPYFSQGKQRYFINQQGLKLNFYSFYKSKNSKTIIILPGRTEPAWKYAELAYDFKDDEFNLYILDHQGQGGSERLLKDTQKGHVEKFSDYTRDLKDWMEKVIQPETPHNDYFLIAHSMAGAIAVDYLGHDHGLIKKAILSAPMIGIRTAPFPSIFVKLVTETMEFFGLGDRYAPLRGPYVLADDPFEKNLVTHSKARFEMTQSVIAQHPRFTLGGPTAHWVSESLKATQDMGQRAKKITSSILIFQAVLESYVVNEDQNSFCKMLRNCKLIKFVNAKHEILHEKDVIRDQMIRHIKDFFSH